MLKRKKHLIIGDSHAHYAFDNQRFTALGNLIAYEQPDVVIDIGDFADMTSLSSYDQGKLAFEGRRYEKDVAAVLDAQEKLHKPWPKSYKPQLEKFLGNHEHRIIREVNDNPKLAGKMSIDDLKYREFGWNVHPFLVPKTLDGITYCHYFVSGVAGRPIGGENVGKSLCNKNHASSVVGHNHCFDHSERSIINGTKIFGLSVGCYVHEKYVEDWNRATVALWWRGIVILEDLDGKGYYDSIKAITQRKILRDYL